MLQAIETPYAGRRFRSRREARWAILFDHLEIDWRYEPDGYHLPDGSMYLPDFELHLKKDSGKVQKLWVEVKPDLSPNSKLSQLCAGSTQFGVIVAEPMIKADVLHYGITGERMGTTSVGRWLSQLTDRDSLSCQAASNAALSARWEHGEKPRRPRKAGGRGPRAYQRSERLLDEPTNNGGSGFTFGS